MTWPQLSRTAGAEPWRELVLVVLVTASCFCSSHGKSVDRETADSRLCSIQNGRISCPVIPLSNQNLTVEGVVYACTVPVYVRFRVKLVHSSRSSDYTFINEDETKEIKELNRTARFTVHLRYTKNYVGIKAGFFEEGYIRYFIETHLPVPSATECAGADLTKGHFLPVVIVIVASIILATAAILLLVWWYKKRQKAKLTASELLADMESSPTSVPYQEEPITSEVSGPKPSSTTVIQNSLYRDSVVLDESALETIAEEGEADDIITSPGGRSHKRRPRKTGAKPSRRDKRGAHAPSKNGYRKTQNELVDVGNPEETTQPPCRDATSASAGANTPLSPNGLELPTSEQPTIARIAPPPKICISPPSGARAKETKTYPT